MKQIIIGLSLLTTLSSYAFSNKDSKSTLISSPSLKAFDGKWVMTDSFCNSGRSGSVMPWSSSFLEINDGILESRVSGPDCISLERLIYSEAESKGDILVYEEIKSIQISKICIEEDKQLFENNVTSVKTKLYINKNKPTEIYQIMEDANCGGEKGLTSIYTKFE